MFKYTYFWVLIIISLSYFFIGGYKNIVSKFEFLFKLSRLPENQTDDQKKIFRFSFPKKEVVVDEAILQNRIKNRSHFLWLRHILIFSGFMVLFLLDQFYTLFVKLIPVEFFVNGMGRGLLKFGLELSGVTLLIGITLALGHRLIYSEEEKRYVDIWLVFLLWLVVTTGFLTEAFRFVVEPDDPFIYVSFFAGPLSLYFKKLSWNWEFLAPLMWVIHATVTAIFFASIPYSKFVHVFMVPIGRSVTLSQNTGELKRQNITEGLL